MADPTFESDRSRPAEDGTPRPGPHDDNALRALAVDELVTLCRWLGIDADPGTVRLEQALPSTPRFSDLLVGAGHGRLSQVEFVRRPTPDLPHRLVEYRSAIMRQAPDSVLRQHVVVLAEGHVETELTDGSEFWCRFHVTYLRELDPADLLTLPALAPLAVLARPPLGQRRTDVLREALQVIHRYAPPTRVPRLAELATVLAAIHLDAATIESLGRESVMPISLEDTQAGRMIAERHRAEGLEQGLSQGFVQGRSEGLSRGEQVVLAQLISARFGRDDRTEQIARRLLGYGEQAAVDAVLTARSLDELDD